MRSGTAGQSFDLFGQIQDFADLRITVVKILQFRTFLDRFVQGDIQRLGNHLGDDVDILGRDGEDSRDVTDGRFRLQGAEGTDLGNVRRAIFLLGVVDDGLSAIATEIDIDIGWFGSARVQKPLEQQVVFERTDMTESQHVRHDGPTGGTTCATRNSLLDGKPDEVPDDQKVTGIAHLLDDRKLEVHPFAMSGSDAVCPVPKDHPLVAELPQIVDVFLPLGGLENRIVTRFQIELNVDSVGDFLGTSHGRFKAGEGGIHLVGGADEQLVGVHLHPVDVRSLDLGIHAQQDIVHRRIGLIQIMSVIRRDEGQSHPIGKIDGHVHALLLD